VALDTSGAALRHGCAARPTLVKPNAVEAGELVGRPVATAAEALVAAQALEGIAYVAVSLGAEGALLVHDGAAWHARPPVIAERSAIGAGDAMLAGLVWGLVQDDAPAALRLGVACGAATAARDGTVVGARDEVGRLLSQVRVDRI
jgi:fructose-1-phosphate kinase PfkB-like protein